MWVPSQPSFYYVSPANPNTTVLFCPVYSAHIPVKLSTHYTGKFKYSYRPINARADKCGIHSAIKLSKIVLKLHLHLLSLILRLEDPCGDFRNLIVNTISNQTDLAKPQRYLMLAIKVGY